MPMIIPWMNTVLAQQGLSELVLEELDAESLLAMRLVERRGPGLVEAVFSVAKAKQHLGRYNTQHLRRQFIQEMVKLGQLRLLQYARTGPCPMPWSDQAAADAAREGHTHILHWMYFEANPPVRTPYALADAFSYAGDGRANWGIESEAAATAGRLDVIKWLRKHDFPLTPNVCYNAASHGHLDILKYTSTLAVPRIHWIREFLRDVEGVRDCVVMETIGTDSPVGFHEMYRECLEKRGWLRVLQWYYPFGIATERARMLELVPREWIEEA